MPRIVDLGRHALALALVLFGMQHLAGPAAGPPFAATSPWQAWLAGALFLAAAVGLIVRRTAAVTAAALGALLLADALVVHLPMLFAKPRDPRPWTSGFEVLAMCGAAWAVSAVRRAEVPGRLLFVAGLAVFAVQHFLYAQFIAGLLPPWIPGALFWAYLVGVAFAAAGLSLATGVQSRLAALLLGLMFFLWVCILHGPRIAAAPHNGNEWTSGAVALAMCGCAWMLADRRGEAGTPVVG